MRGRSHWVAWLRAMAYHEAGHAANIAGRSCRRSLGSLLRRRDCTERSPRRARSRRAVRPLRRPPRTARQGIELVDGLGNGGQPDGPPREIVHRRRPLPVRPHRSAPPPGPRRSPRNRRPSPTREPSRARSRPSTSRCRTAARTSWRGICPKPSDRPTSPARPRPPSYDRSTPAAPLYAFAGIETDLTDGSLQPVGDSDGAADLRGPRHRASRSRALLRLGCRTAALRRAWATTAARPRSPSRSRSAGRSSPSTPRRPTPSIPPR